MKTTILTCLLPCLFIIGCTEKQNPLPLSNDFHSEKTADNEPLEGLVFSESSGAYILPKEDPYSLSNFQRALKNVLNGCSEIEFPNGITKSSFENINLSP